MQAIVLRHVFAFVFSCLLSLYLIPLIIRATRRMGLLDVPDGNLKQHKEPIPHFGGIAVFLGFISTLALVYPFENKVLWLLLGTTLLLLVGLIDDLKVLRPGQKFFGQILAVLCFLKGGFSLKTNFFSSPLNLGFSAFWMLSVINAFNLVDVMDGLSSIIAIVATTSLLVISLIFQQYTVSLLLVCFLGPLLAFFWYNKPPARIYLGDTGSMFVGGFLSAVPMLFAWSSQSFDAYYAPVVILGIPLLEVFFLIIIRSYLRIPFYRGSPHHFSIYLQKKNWNKSKVLIFTGIMGIILSTLAFMFLFNVMSLWLLILSLLLFLTGWCIIIFR